MKICRWRPLMAVGLVLALIPWSGRPAEAQDAQPTPAAREGAGGTAAGELDVERASDGREMVAGAVLVRFRRGASESARQAAHGRAAGQVIGRLRLPDTVRVQVPRGREIELAAAYRGQAAVEAAQPDYVVRALGTAVEPDDPLFDQQYGLERIAAAGAWEVARGAGVKIAILDTGIFADHPDLSGQVVDQENFSNSPSLGDRYGHGTHVAGTAAAKGLNARGVIGVAFEAKLMNGKVLNDGGGGSTSAIIDGLYWAAENGAKVINLSVGANSDCEPVLQAAVDAARTAGAVVVASAGNNGAKVTGAPASCDHVVAVAATTPDDARAHYSNYGSGVDVAAPGSEIISTLPNGHYGLMSGTSMAAPHVAGLAALIWSSGLSSTPDEVVAAIACGADPIPGTGTDWAHGRVNAAAAVAPPTMATRLEFAAEPGDGRVGVEFATQPVVVATDTAGKRACQFDGPVSLRIKPNADAPKAAFGQPGRATVEARAGHARFEGLSLDRFGRDYVLVASAGELAEAETEPFTILDRRARCRRPRPTFTARPEIGTAAVRLVAKPRIDPDGNPNDPPDCRLVSLLWDFDVARPNTGPADTATQMTVVHDYGGAGKFRVSLTVSDSAGRMGKRAKVVRVRPVSD